MKYLVNITRILVGTLFIFSGLVKANDPLGLSYKMQEFFDVWARNPGLSHLMHWLDRFSLPFSIIMITLEVIVGVAILLGVWKKFFSWLLLLLIIFFGFLTGYAVISGKIATCGCFGDCIPLTALESFIKDLILFGLVLIIFFGVRHIRPVFRPGVNFFLLTVSVVFVLGFQNYVLKHLPVWDCLPYKVGNNLIELRKMPADAVPDKKAFRFYYQKNGVVKEFSESNLPDSTWQFVRREDFVVQKGKDNEPPVKDFYLTTQSGVDSTEGVLNTPGSYYMFFVRNLSSGTDRWIDHFVSIYKEARQQQEPIFIIATDPDKASHFFNQENHYNLPVLSL
ncbi:MAG: DoxX family membrane protein, partial [Bacteroidota bacterium]|nr:DoxX family membrane protein [Bacteroidota bacterium]